MTLAQLLDALRRQLDDAPDSPQDRRLSGDVNTYTVAVWETPGDYGNEINSVRVNHDQRIVWLET